MLNRTVGLVRSCGLVLVCVFAAAPAQASDWEYLVEPYLLASSIEGDAGLGRVTGVEVDVDFSKILETLSIGAMLHVEAHHDSGWGVILDYGFMDLEDDISSARGGNLSAEVNQGVLEALVTKRLDIGDGNFEALFGVRWWDNDVETTVDPAILPGTVKADLDEDWVDPVIGVRWTAPLGKAWHIVMRGDVGGFGVGADFTWNLAASALYKMTDSATLEIGYKALDVDYETGSRGSRGYFAYDTTTHGPVIGVQFRF